MPYTVTVPDHAPILAQEGQKLVLAIEGGGVDISHRCGGNARCTTCAVTFQSEEPSMGDTERECLVEDGVMGQFRLACQIRVDRDMAVTPLHLAHVKGWEPGPAVEP